MEVSKITFTVPKPKGERPCGRECMAQPEIVHARHTALRGQEPYPGLVREQENQGCNAKRNGRELVIEMPKVAKCSRWGG